MLGEITNCSTTSNEVSKILLDVVKKQQSIILKLEKKTRHSRKPSMARSRCLL